MENNNVPQSDPGVNYHPRSGNTRERILDVAIDLLSINGYSGVSIRDIARAVGIKESSIYNHYPSKEAILEEICDRYEQAFGRLTPSEEQVAQILERITPEQFWENGFRNFKELMGQPRMMKMVRILTMEVYRSERVRRILLRYSIHAPVDFAERIFRRLMERGQIRSMDARRLALGFQGTLFTLYIEYLMLHSAGEDTREVEQQVRDHIHFYRDLVKIED